MDEEIKSFLREKGLGEIIYTDVSSEIMAETNKIFNNEFKIHYRNQGILIPFPLVYVIRGEKLQALSLKLNGKYPYILLYNGIFNIHREYLVSVNKGILSSNAKFIDEMMEYTWKFIVLHEYGHIFCGHCLEGQIYKITQEYEADLVAIDALISMIINNNSFECVESELIKCFISIFYWFKDMDKNNDDDSYNMLKADNYYELKDRDHPLNIQRILYIYQEFNVIIYNQKDKSTINIKEKIIEKLLELGEKKSEDGHIEGLWNLAKDSIQEMRDNLNVIRHEIPRLGLFNNF